MSDKLDFELRLINIHWSNKSQFAYITEISKHPVVFTEKKDRYFTAEIPSYPRLNDKIACQFAIQCSSNLIFETPKVKLEQNTLDLFPVLDSKYGKWWIEKGNWRKSEQSEYHDAPSCRHAGEFIILIGNITINLNITPSGFTLIEYQELLASFKGELWQLILDKDSTTTISKDGKGKSPGKEFQKQVIKFIKFANQILAKPTQELRERQEIQRIEKVRPTPKTFMELLTKGASVKFVTGRGYEPTYNTPDNKYIADIINRLVLIVRNLKNGISYTKESLERSIEFIQDQLSQNTNDFVSIDPAKLIIEIEQEERKKRRWFQKKIEFEKSFLKKVTGGNVIDKFIFEVTSQPRTDEQYPDYTSVWIKYKEPYVLKFPSEYCDNLFFKKGTIYKIRGLTCRYLKSCKNKNALPKTEINLTHILWVEKLTSIDIVDNDPHDQVIATLKYEQSIYSKNNWQRELNAKEKHEKEIEQFGLKKRKDMLSSVADKYEKKEASFNSIYKDLLALLKKCKILNITVNNRLDYPGTMTFVENPSYRGAYSSYKVIQNDAKFEDLFDDLLTIQDFGITDQPNIYEKWCLLQIINVLEGYGFIHDKDWEKRLVSLISQNNFATVSFIFKHPLLNQEIELIHQPEIENRRKPDFMLKIKRNNRVTVLVLDAKNKDYSQASAKYNTFSDDLNNLINKKNYSESGNNAVFILHPKIEKGFLPVSPTPQIWSSHSTIGGSSIFDWEDIGQDHDHKYGGVQVRPENLDNLKMVIALSLQYLTEDNYNVYNKESTNKSKFCLICGGIDFDKTEKCSTKGKHYTCHNCMHFFIEHYCQSCGNRIWKHGSYWTYHDTRSTEPYNIKCPKCGDFYLNNKTTAKSYEI